MDWPSYLWIGSICIVAAWCTYRYYLWARGMDKINADHWEYLRSPGRMIEGVNYFVAEEPIVTSTTFQNHLVEGASRFPTACARTKRKRENN